MLHNFDPWTTQITGYVIANWFMTVCTSAALLFVYFRQRYLFTKPSLLLVSLSHVIFQWPLAVFSGFYETWLPHPWGLVALVHGTIIGSLSASIVLFRPIAGKLWSEIALTSAGGARSADDARLRASAYCLFGLTAALGTTYFSYVPIDCTGIYALLVSPDQFYLAREISLKLLADKAPRYAAWFIITTAAPLLTTVVTLSLLNAGWRITRRDIVMIVLVLIAWAMASINGAKANLAYLGLAIVALTLWRRELRIPLLRLPFMLGLALLPAFIVILIITVSPFKGEMHDFSSCFTRVHLTVASEAEVLVASAAPSDMAPPSAQIELTKMLAEYEAKLGPPPLGPSASSQENGFSHAIRVASYYFQLAKYHTLRDVQKGVAVVSYYAYVVGRQISAILNRSVVVPFQVGAWYVHYFQTQGPMGLGAIPRLGEPLGYTPIDASNRIAMVYGPEYEGHPVPPHMSAPAGFLFSYFAYFGYWAIAINVFLIVALDVAIFALVRIDRALLLPSLATLSVAVLKFAESDYTTVWITHGYALILIVSLAITYVIRLVGRRKEPNFYA